MELDAARIAGWIEPLGKRAGEILEVFVESRREAVLELVDGQVTGVRDGEDGTGLVEVTQRAANQDGELSATGTALVRLPSH